MFNLGLGAAKNIEISWLFSFDKAISHINAITSGTEYESSFFFQNDVLKCDSEKIGKWWSMWHNQRFDKIDFILPASEIKEGGRLKLPDPYVKIISVLVFLYSRLLSDKSMNDMPEMPKIEVNISCADIADKKYVKKFIINISVYAITLDTSDFNGFIEAKLKR
jgi:hypothetical protein